MVMIAVKCPVCGETDVSKNGKTIEDTQKYICNNKKCTGRSFLQEYTYTGRKQGIDEQIIVMTSKASGIRDTSRVLKYPSNK